jgi:hypothetical protein
VSGWGGVCGGGGKGKRTPRIVSNRGDLVFWRIQHVFTRLLAPAIFRHPHTPFTRPPIKKTSDLD